jgi:hypothetical protein
MASLDLPVLSFDENGCPDCGVRQVELPGALPTLGDDFDWDVRDFDSFRAQMLEEVMARFPERKRWTRADLEVVLLEALAFILDQLSDMADRVFAEGYLETARRPEQVLKLLRLIGYDPAVSLPLAPGAQVDDREARLLKGWSDNSSQMEAARREGPRRISEQFRAVTLGDYEVELPKHPLVELAVASRLWNGSQWVIQVAVSLAFNLSLDDLLNQGNDRFDLHLGGRIAAFHAERSLPIPEVQAGAPSWASFNPRAILTQYVDSLRMVGQKVELLGAVPVGVDIRLSLELDEDYFQSEMRHAAYAALGRDPGQFFEPGRFRFGESVYQSDIIQVLSALEGVLDVTVERFGRIGGNTSPDEPTIGLRGREVARCDNDLKRPQFGRLVITTCGGRSG